MTDTVIVADVIVHFPPSSVGCVITISVVLVVRFRDNVILQYVLDTYFIGWEDKSMHESSPSNRFLANYSKNYSRSQYFPSVEPGAVSYTHLTLPTKA